MRYISIEDWNEIPKDYKSVWSNDEMRGTKHNGKRTWMIGQNGMSVLLIEGTGFTIVDPDEDGNFEIECDECDGTGAIEHDVSCYTDITPTTEFRECETCNGSQTNQTFYDGY
tara:strand:+ start:9941 stop:10279 length:339 start_codon:yes stop_codon:yes gene_type:complete